MTVYIPLCETQNFFFFRLLTGMAGVLKFLKDTKNLKFIPPTFKSVHSILTLIQTRASYCLFICKLTQERLK